MQIDSGRAFCGCRLLPVVMHVLSLMFMSRCSHYFFHWSSGTPAPAIVSFEFLFSGGWPQLNRKPQNWQFRALTYWSSFTSSRIHLWLMSHDTWFMTLDIRLAKLQMSVINFHFKIVIHHHRHDSSQRPWQPWCHHHQGMLFDLNSVVQVQIK